jgi:hypothetical protein
MRECDQEKCCCPCHNEMEESCCQKNGQEDFTSYLLEAADCAWMEVLKDKIKEYILSTQNDHMTELAKIIAEANNQRWKNKMEKKQGNMNLQEQLCHFFGQSKK